MVGILSKILHMPERGDFEYTLSVDSGCIFCLLSVCTAGISLWQFADIPIDRTVSDEQHRPRGLNNKGVLSSLANQNDQRSQRSRVLKQTFRACLHNKTARPECECGTVLFATWPEASALLFSCKVCIGNPSWRPLLFRRFFTRRCVHNARR